MPMIITSSKSVPTTFEYSNINHQAEIQKFYYNIDLKPRVNDDIACPRSECSCPVTECQNWNKYS
jgi:hypothetical protein